MDASIGKGIDRTIGAEPAQRTAALADSRRQASEAALQQANAAEARRADQREMVRAILERAVGANTKVAISRNESNNAFTYRAIDIDSGEVIREWPPARAAQFVQEHGASGELAKEVLSGLLLDEQA